MDAQAIQAKLDGLRQGLAQLEQQLEQVQRAAWAQRGAVLAMEQLLAEMQPEQDAAQEGDSGDNSRPE